MKLYFNYMLLLLVVFTSCNSSEIETLQLSQQSATADQALPEGTNWMSFIPGERKLSSLSIPGTHDAGARYEPVSGTAKTQNLTLAEQLNAGVRFLDVRCRFVDNNFAIHHGPVYQHLNFDDVLQSCKSFLQAHPSETIIMSVKEEHTPSGNSMTFEQRFMKYTDTYSGLFRLDATIPSLQQARGKIVLLRRFSSAQTLGIQAYNGWSDNTSFTIQNPESTVQVQDAYQVGNNTDKWNAINTLLNTSKNADVASGTLFLNFSSGYQKKLWVIPNIPSVSNEINPKLLNYFNQQTTGRFGVIITDFIYADLAKSIFNTNF
ncbi:phosphatidylinositol-specific phospholipase C [Sphingobacterium spiritivorum]|uniref:phosphatidylinositol-specific phospholipase C n=1 Tax=Sphingobacterium spiritivorum TaxID=258 RepID=UPI001F22A381|nr:phosphatidylinositol-specific phospholipase C [Sphingobacterium spiritivorum]